MEAHEDRGGCKEQAQCWTTTARCNHKYLAVRRHDHVLRHMELKNLVRWTPGQCGGADSQNMELAALAYLQSLSAQCWMFGSGAMSGT